jgi:hypothetical protein
LLEIEAPAVGDLGEPATSNMSCCNLEGVEHVPVVWLLEKHTCGDIRANGLLWGGRNERLRGYKYRIVKN